MGILEGKDVNVLWTKGKNRNYDTSMFERHPCIAEPLKENWPWRFELSVSFSVTGLSRWEPIACRRPFYSPPGYSLEAAFFPESFASSKK
jgi:hypothetical protein